MAKRHVYTDIPVHRTQSFGKHEDSVRAVLRQILVQIQIQLPLPSCLVLPSLALPCLALPHGLPVCLCHLPGQLATGSASCSAGCVIVWTDGGWTGRPDSDWFFNDGAEHIKQVDNVIPSASASGNTIPGIVTTTTSGRRSLVAVFGPFLHESTHKKDHFACLGPIHRIGSEPIERCGGSGLTAVVRKARLGSSLVCERSCRVATDTHLRRYVFFFAGQHCFGLIEWS